MQPITESVFRFESARVIGALMRRFGDLDLAEDAFQDACVAALQSWPQAGLPRSPGAWLTTVAANAALDRIRRESRRLPKEIDSSGLRDPSREPASPGADEEYDLTLLDDGPLSDDQLRLVFLCCHPALATEAQVALTLRTVGGLTTSEVARAYLVPDATMAQRLVRAKRKIVAAGIPFRMPEGTEQAQRLAAVLHVVYLIFNEGYSATDREGVVRPDLCLEAIRLATLLQQLLPHDAEVLGLRALLLLQDARRPARVDDDGRLIPLDDQDRSRWNSDQIAAAVALTERALAIGPVGQYQVQAAIAALHAEAPSAAETDWPQIAELYRLLGRIAPGPMVTLNAAVATAMVEGPSAGLALLDELTASGTLAGHHRLPATRAQLLERQGATAAARAAYDEALALVDNPAERDYLAVRRDRLGAG